MLFRSKAADDFQKKMSKAIKREGGKKRVYLEMWNSPYMTVGGGSFLELAIESAGGENVFSDSPAEYPKASPEEIIKRNPEVVVLLYKPEDDYRERVYIKNTSAGKRGNVFIYPDIDVLLRPGPRYAEGVEILKGLLGGAE